MLKVMESAVEKYQWYIGESWQYLLFLLALLYLIYSSRERESRRLFCGIHRSVFHHLPVSGHG